MLNCTRSNKKLFTSKKFTNWLNFCNLDDSPRTLETQIYLINQGRNSNLIIKIGGAAHDAVGSKQQAIPLVNFSCRCRLLLRLKNGEKHFVVCNTIVN